jgi:hypothetical protein
MALECFKILYKLSPPCLNDLVVLKNSKYSFRYSNIVEIPRVKTTTYGKNSHLHSFPFQDNKMFLNWLKLAIFLKSSGRSFHKTAAVYLKEFLP